MLCNPLATMWMMSILLVQPGECPRSREPHSQVAAGMSKPIVFLVALLAMSRVCHTSSHFCAVTIWQVLASTCCNPLLSAYLKFDLSKIIKFSVCSFLAPTSLAKRLCLCAHLCTLSLAVILPVDRTHVSTPCHRKQTTDCVCASRIVLP